MDHSAIKIAKINNIFLYFLVYLNVLYIELIKESKCDISSFSFDGTFSFEGTSSAENATPQFPLPVPESQESHLSHYTISMPEESTQKRGRGRGKPTIQSTTMHPRFIVIPSAIVFKADGVFWPFRVETDFIGPFKQKRGYGLTDVNGTPMKMYEHAGTVLKTFHKKGVNLGVMEQTKLGGKIINLLKLLHLDVFRFWHINEDSEINNMKRIKTKANVDFRDIVYVGINETTLQEMRDLGVITFKLQCGKGLQLEHLNEIIHEFATRPYIGPTESIEEDESRQNESSNIDEELLSSMFKYVL